jgi:hypothetical protein
MTGFIQWARDTLGGALMGLGARVRGYDTIVIEPIQRRTTEPVVVDGSGEPGDTAEDHEDVPTPPVTMSQKAVDMIAGTQERVEEEPPTTKKPKRGSLKSRMNGDG